MNPRAHLKPDGTLASAAFSNSRGTQKLSVDWAERSTPHETIDRFPGWPDEKFVAVVTAQVYWAFDQSIEYSPHALNQAHSDVVGQKSDAVRKQLAMKARAVHPKIPPEKP